jgi:hypothetical protein
MASACDSIRLVPVQQEATGGQGRQTSAAGSPRYLLRTIGPRRRLRLSLRQRVAAADQVAIW